MLSQLGAALCYWLIESVFRAAALPRRLVLARAHCNRTNENTPHHLPRRDTPSPSPCPSTLVSPAFLFLFPLQPPCICPPAPDCHISYSIFLFTCSLPPLLPLYFALFHSLLPHLPSSSSLSGRRLPALGCALLWRYRTPTADFLDVGCDPYRLTLKVTSGR